MHCQIWFLYIQYSSSSSNTQDLGYTLDTPAMTCTSGQLLCLEVYTAFAAPVVGGTSRVGNPPGSQLIMRRRWTVVA